MKHVLATTSRRSALAVLTGALLAPGLGRPAFSLDMSSLMFFDWGSSEITPEAKPSVTRISSRIKKNSRVTVSGHCDTSEKSPDALSLARAEAVKKALVAVGVPESSITAIGKGTNQKLVPTGADQREPQNRFVDIAIK